MDEYGCTVVTGIVCSMAVLCWYDSHHFWINTGRLKSIPRLYAATLQRLHSYNVLVVSVCTLSDILIIFCCFAFIAIIEKWKIPL